MEENGVQHESWGSFAHGAELRHLRLRALGGGGVPHRAPMDTNDSLFYSHQDPAMVKTIGGRRPSDKASAEDGQPERQSSDDARACAPHPYRATEIAPNPYTREGDEWEGRPLAQQLRANRRPDRTGGVGSNVARLSAWPLGVPIVIGSFRAEWAALRAGAQVPLRRMCPKRRPG
jgi:hypothetical protein